MGGKGTGDRKGEKGRMMGTEVWEIKDDSDEGVEEMERLMDLIIQAYVVMLMGLFLKGEMKATEKGRG